ncbi:SMI1/KNR4 family protein [Flavobacterium tyrosinilyticum]|uniref:SMI1/KNR4 family protein n=1 Tax=Flavobacterium tyrosinilyticum TaxID=1658740 RepID=UPI00202F3577|nr:SMI1/KNR4 family protein [Flavobacterium tyrosinilyticum]MCM0665145.1 SMI1/KNR4 family protein [Flavobacterium tyrosinilyticum]
MMIDLVNRLNDQLETSRLDYYNNLKEPLSDKEIEILEEKYQVQIPNDLKELYKWKNGQDQNCYEAFVNNSMFMSLEDVLDSREEFNSMIDDFEIENWWNENWLPIFHNGGGSYICYDLSGIFTGKKGQLIEYWNRDNDRNVISLNLEDFIAQLTIYYSNTKSEDFDEYFAIEKIDNYPIRFIVE